MNRAPLTATTFPLLLLLVGLLFAACSSEATKASDTTKDASDTKDSSAADAGVGCSVATLESCRRDGRTCPESLADARATLLTRCSDTAISLFEYECVSSPFTVVRLTQRDSGVSYYFDKLTGQLTAWVPRSSSGQKTCFSFEPGFHIPTDCEMQLTDLCEAAASDAGQDG